ncbi:MAG: hypothetical protein CFE44_02060 [Burkholderiales bacterium PBB4]|nr:MAG: hypothetical protein CFE44_02060 [Burkholderiales bacterium PBB4]
MPDLKPHAARIPCPSCRNGMEVHVLPGVNALHGGTVELDLCFACQGMWFDPSENLKLAPAAVAELFKLLHAHRDAARLAVAPQLGCPRCKNPLTQGFDVVRTGRYITYRCANGHGRFSPFSSFMIEKGFVRHLTRPEVDDIARAVGTIHCTCCGAPVDVRKDHACPHCRAAFSLLDPKAVEKALQGYAKASAATATQNAPDLADALIALERERERAKREAKPQTGKLFTGETDDGLDLLAVGIALVWKMLD